MNNILIFNHDLKMYPPILSIINILIELNRSVCVVGYCSDKKIISNLENQGVKYFEVIINDTKDYSILKLIKLFFYRRKVFTFLQSLASADTFVWVFGNQNIWLLSRAIAKYKSIIYLFEIPELSISGRYRILSPIISYKQVMNSAYKVVCSEYNRAHITKAYFGLKTLPAIIPNKPTFSLNEICDPFEKLFANDSRKIILYQGIFNFPERRLEELCQSINYLSDEYIIVIMGPDCECKSLMQSRYESKRVFFLPFVSPPLHLQITKRAFIGFLSYFAHPGLIESCLNTLYCAPNKIYEYSKFDVPMIANDTPAIKYLFNIHGSGICIEDFTAQGIAKAVESISKNYDSYSLGSRNLYDSVDMRGLIENLIE
jgi:glycosyltransferase involved in cell wall biosynthesis